MRILRWTNAAAERLLAGRRGRDLKAERVAARILADVRRRGDSAVLGWTRRLDGIAVDPASIWIGRHELEEACRQVGRKFLRAVEHAARNIRRVAERQLPRAWSF